LPHGLSWSIYLFITTKYLFLTISSRILFFKATGFLCYMMDDRRKCGACLIFRKALTLCYCESQLSDGGSARHNHVELFEIPLRHLIRAAPICLLHAVLQRKSHRDVLSHYSVFMVILFQFIREHMISEIGNVWGFTPRLLDAVLFYFHR